MVTAIIFDCFGVLTTDHWKEFIATLPTEQVEAARALMYRYDSGSLDTAGLMEAVKELTNREPQGVEMLLHDEVAKNEQLLTYIAQLKETYKIGLLSNVGSNWIRDAFLTTEEQALFNTIILSYEVGLAKPDQAIFELVCRQLGELPINCVLIDDSEGHCMAAARLGIHTIVYTNFKQMTQQLEALLPA